MPHRMNDYSNILKTNLQRGHPSEVKEKRKKRINEALSWKGGKSLDSTKRYDVSPTLNENLDVYFLKPGKEVFRSRNPNVNDMTPCIGENEEPYTFLDIWKQLSQLSVDDFEAFKAVLTLIYRDAYLLDHQEVDVGIIRYKPKDDILSCIQELEKKVENSFEYGLTGLLDFLDILGWNEDVKYHVEDKKVTFIGKRNWKVGRVNTLLTCINIPYKTLLTVKEIVENSSDLQDVDWDLVYGHIQTFINARGVSPPRQQDLLNWLSPYIVDKKSLHSKKG